MSRHQPRPLHLAMKITTTLFCFVAALVGSVSLRAVELGMPLVKNFSFSDFRAGPIVRNVVQDGDGELFFVMRIAEEVYSFDGVSWRQRTKDLPCTPLALALAGDSLYVLCNNDVIRVNKDTGAGTSLTGQHTGAPLIDVASVGPDLYVLAADRLFHWHRGERQETAALTGQATGLLVVHERVYITGSAGLVEVDGPGPSPLAPLVGEPVVQATPLSDGRALAALKRDGDFSFQLVNKGSARAWPGRLPDKLAGMSITAMATTPLDEVVVGVADRGVAMFGPEGQLRSIFTERYGLPNQRVHDLLVDRQGALWVCHDKGVTRLSIDLPLTVFDSQHGVQGIILSFERFRGDLYVAGHRGVFKLISGTEEEPPRFEAIADFPDGSSAKLLAHEDRLFATSPRGLVELSDGTARILVAGDYRSLTTTADPDVLLAGGGQGIDVLKRHGDGYRVLQKISSPPHAIGLLHNATGQTTFVWCEGERRLSSLRFVDGYDRPPEITEARCRPRLAGHGLAARRQRLLELGRSLPLSRRRADSGRGARRRALERASRPRLATVVSGIRRDDLAAPARRCALLGRGRARCRANHRRTSRLVALPQPPRLSRGR